MPAATTRTCPFCVEAINAAARVCPRCTRELPTPGIPLAAWILIALALVVIVALFAGAFAFVWLGEQTGHVPRVR